MRFVSNAVSFVVRFPTPRSLGSIVRQTGWFRKKSRSARSCSRGVVITPCLSSLADRFLTMTYPNLSGLRSFFRTATTSSSPSPTKRAWETPIVRAPRSTRSPLQNVDGGHVLVRRHDRQYDARSCPVLLDREFTCATTMSWPAVAVRTMPGRSMIVRSGTVARAPRRWRVDENARFPGQVRVHTSMARQCRGRRPPWPRYVAGELLARLAQHLTDSRHRSSLCPSSIGTGTASPTRCPAEGHAFSASSTDDLPQDWSPRRRSAAATSFSTPRRRISSTRSSIGLTSFWFWRDKALASMLTSSCC